MKINFIFTLKSFLFLLFFALSHATAQSPYRNGKWNVLKTVHFNIYYESNQQRAADTAAYYLETFYEYQRKTFNFASLNTGSTQVVLSGSIDESNGSASVIGSQININLKPSAHLSGDTINWLKRVISHELTHLLMYKTLSNWAGVYGEIYKSIYLPFWFVEGIAQLTSESWDAKRNLFHTTLYAQGEDLSYEILEKTLYTDPINGRQAYEQGHHFTRFLVASYSPSLVGNLLKSMQPMLLVSELSLLFYPLNFYNKPFEKAVLLTTGETLKDLWEKYQAQNKKIFKERYALNNANLNSNKQNLLFDAKINNSFAAIFSAKNIGPNRYIITAQEKGLWKNRLWYVDETGYVKKLSKAEVGWGFDVSKDYKWIAYTANYNSYNQSGEQWLVVQERLLGKETKVIKGAHNPIMLGADTVVAAQYYKGKPGIVLYHILSNSKKVIEAPEEIASIQSVAESNENFVWVACALENGKGALYRYYFKEEFWSHFYTHEGILEFPVVSQNKDLFFIDAYKGTQRVNKLNLANKEVQTWLQTAKGAINLHACTKSTFCYSSPVWPSFDKTASNTNSQANTDANNTKNNNTNIYNYNFEFIKDNSINNQAYSQNSIFEKGHILNPLALATSYYFNPYDTVSYNVQNWMALYTLPSLPQVKEINAPPEFESKEYRFNNANLETRDSVPILYKKSNISSLQGIRPLIFFPYLSGDPAGVGIGAGAWIADPRTIHTIWGGITLPFDEVLYSLNYKYSGLYWDVNFHTKSNGEYIIVKTDMPRNEEGRDAQIVVRRSFTGISTTGSMLPLIAQPWYWIGGLAGGIIYNTNYTQISKSSSKTKIYRNRGSVEDGSDLSWSGFQNIIYQPPHQYSYFHPLSIIYISGLINFDRGQFASNLWNVEAGWTHQLYEPWGLTGTLRSGIQRTTREMSHFKAALYPDQDTLDGKRETVQIIQVEAGLPLLKGQALIPLLGRWEMSRLGLSYTWSNVARRWEKVEGQGDTPLYQDEPDKSNNNINLELKSLFFIGGKIPYEIALSFSSTNPVYVDARSISSVALTAKIYLDQIKITSPITRVSPAAHRGNPSPKSLFLKPGF